MVIKSGYKSATRLIHRLTNHPSLPNQQLHSPLFYPSFSSLSSTKLHRFITSYATCSTWTTPFIKTNVETVTETEGESGSRKDRIILKGITLYGYDGVIPRDQARGVSHKLVVDLQLVADLKVAGETDQLSRTINYVQVFDAIGGALQKSNSLLETMANNIAKTLLHNFTHIHQVTVCIKKPADAINGINGINGILDYVAFQIVRSRTN